VDQTRISVIARQLTSAEPNSVTPLSLPSSFNPYSYSTLRYTIPEYRHSAWSKYPSTKSHPPSAHHPSRTQPSSPTRLFEPKYRGRCQCHCQLNPRIRASIPLPLPTCRRTRVPSAPTRRSSLNHSPRNKHKYKRNSPKTSQQSRRKKADQRPQRRSCGTLAS